MLRRSVNLSTLFLGRLRPPKRLTSTSCTYFPQELTTALLEKAERETKVCCQTGYRTQDPCLTSQVPYRLRYAAWREVRHMKTYQAGHPTSLIRTFAGGTDIALTLSYLSRDPKLPFTCTGKTYQTGWLSSRCTCHFLGFCPTCLRHGAIQGSGFPYVQPP